MHPKASFGRSRYTFVAVLGSKHILQRLDRFMLIITQSLHAKLTSQRRTEQQKAQDTAAVGYGGLKLQLNLRTKLSRDLHKFGGGPQVEAQLPRDSYMNRLHCR